MYTHQLSKINRLFIIFTILLAVLLAACGNDDEEKDNEADKHYTIGIINLTDALDPIVDGFKSQMTELGYIEGENITYIYDGPSDSIDGLDSIAQNLVEADVDLILSISTPASQAVQRATTEKPIPCVFAPIQDPVGSGLVNSLAEPGGNMTGVTLGVAEGKRLEWLIQIVPGVKRVYIPYNINDPAPVAGLEVVSKAADQLGVELVSRPTRNAEEVADAIENIPDDVDAMMILSDSVMGKSDNDILAAAIEHKLPLSFPLSHSVVNGALMSYGAEATAIGELTAQMADKILKGANPAELPVERGEFFLSINLQTAEAIGLEIPDDILRQADIIIREEE